MKKYIQGIGCVCALAGIAALARDARANNIDLPAPSEVYPIGVGITSPGATEDSHFEFNGTYGVKLSDANFLIETTVNSNGSIDGTTATVVSVSLTPALDTSFAIGGAPVFVTFLWQSGAANVGTINANSGVVGLKLSFKLKFTGTWKGNTQTCITGAVNIDMESAGTTYPHTTLTGSAYSFTSGAFRIVSNGFDIPAVNSTLCGAANTTALVNALSVGALGSTSGMKIDHGFPTYDYNLLPVSGS